MKRIVLTLVLMLVVLVVAVSPSLAQLSTTTGPALEPCQTAFPNEQVGLVKFGIEKEPVSGEPFCRITVDTPVDVVIPES